MVLLDISPVHPASEPVPGTPLSIRAATPADLPRTVALELAGASLPARLFPGLLVRLPQRRALTCPDTVSLVCEQPGHDGRPRVVGLVTGTRRGLVELLVVDGAEQAEAAQAALLGAFLRACRDRRRAALSRC